MNFYLSNSKLDKQISDIRQKLMLSMNGIVTEQMENKGIRYKKNYGVSIPRIKEIAKEYEKNTDLADRLWMMDIRETKILSTLLQPLESFSIEKSISRIGQINQMELVEQICMNLLCKLPYALELSFLCINSDKLWSQITGFVLSARIYNQYSTEEAIKFIDKAFVLANTEEFLLYKSIAVSLSRLCRTGSTITDYLLFKLDETKALNPLSIQYIGNELKQEIDFLKGI